jgi:peptide deformylase
MAKRVYANKEDTPEHRELLKKLAIYPEKVLHEKATEFSAEELKDSDKIKYMYETMFEVMYYFNGIGLAAQQAHFLKRIFVMDIEEDNKYKVQDAFVCTDCKSGEKVKAHKMVVINPEILERSKEKDMFEEGCLSLPEVRVKVARPKTIKIKFLDENLNEKIYFADSLLAKCMQHEIDHLDGILLPDKISLEASRILGINLDVKAQLEELKKMER